MVQIGRGKHNKWMWNKEDISKLQWGQRNKWTIDNNLPGFSLIFFVPAALHASSSLFWLRVQQPEKSQNKQMEQTIGIMLHGGQRTVRMKLSLCFHVSNLLLQVGHDLSMIIWHVLSKTDWRKGLWKGGIRTPSHPKGRRKKARQRKGNARQRGIKSSSWQEQYETRIRRERTKATKGGKGDRQPEQKSQWKNDGERRERLKSIRTNILRQKETERMKAKEEERKPAQSILPKLLLRNGRGSKKRGRRQKHGRDASGRGWG